MALATGGFTDAFARKRKGKLNAKLMDAIIRIIQPGCKVVDAGAGDGQYVRELIRRGYDAVGLDSTPDIFAISGEVVHFCDLAKPMIMHEQADVALCIEVGEHVPEEFLPMFLDNVSSLARTALICSWAIPGQRGRDHVSCRLPEWVAAEFGHRGWFVQHEDTILARRIAGKGWDKKLLVMDRR
jgi:SAM-dependent methyltransferase